MNPYRSVHLAWALALIIAALVLFLDFGPLRAAPGWLRWIVLPMVAAYKWATPPPKNPST